MPNQYPEKKGWKVPKQRYKVSNWSDYNAALCQRGRLDLWVSDEVADSWYEEERINDGPGAPRVFTDAAIMTCHEVRQVFHLPLRQTQGFMSSLFNLAGLELQSPSYIPVTLQNARLMLLLFTPLEPLKFGNRMTITCISKVPREQKSNRLNLAF